LGVTCHARAKGDLLRDNEKGGALLSSKEFLLRVFLGSVSICQSGINFLVAQATSLSYYLPYLFAHLTSTGIDD